MHVRQAECSDAGEIRSVHLLAFPTSGEADLVEQLVRDGDAMISVVAVELGKVVGHALLSRMNVQAGGRTLTALGLAPVAVVPELQNRGVGSALIEAAVNDARRLGVDLVFVLGESEFYGRFGFDSETARPFANRYAGPYFQALLLNGAIRPLQSGTASYAPAFESL